ncbi:hypothetical protein [Vibrio parahaemolyticus]|uniref:hypothetical protein n=1 Tax=Vibrio parahaemolyticus TaxID=670 RepID=UPI00226B1AB0|nr:hypothetical protein [Vibrio parahaemolyticus]MCX8941275.1 hypothetical protein [Vibrio parahaemolyticus]
MAKKFKVEARFLCDEDLNDWLKSQDGGRSNYLRHLSQWARENKFKFETKTVTVLKER